ncbi:MAG: metallopeptidase family protein, partial [Deltaproteobacteria bacterium]|nr:metallopeptidase family protein [Deltaproteobacteria bacterium]
MAPSDNLFEQEGLFEGREGENSEPVKVSDKEFDRIVKRAIHRIPEELREHLDNVLISVRKRASQEMLEEMDVPPGEELLGFFSGIPLVDQSVTDPPIYSDTIFIFQEPLEEMCGTLEELEEEIELTVVHEIAHYFGISEER